MGDRFVYFTLIRYGATCGSENSHENGNVEESCVPRRNFKHKEELRMQCGSESKKTSESTCYQAYELHDLMSLVSWELLQVLVSGWTGHPRAESKIVWKFIEFAELPLS